MKYEIKYNSIIIPKVQRGVFIKDVKVRSIRDKLGVKYSVFNDSRHIQIIYYGDWWRIEENINNCDIAYLISVVKEIIYK